MVITQKNIRPKSGFSLKLLTVTLFFSVFSFSGYAGVPSQQQQNTTELVVSLRPDLKRTVSYKKARTFFYNLPISKDRSPGEFNILQWFAKRLLKTKFDENVKQILTFKKCAFVTIKYLPESAEEDILHSLIG